MALTQVSTGGIKDDAVTDAKLPANSVGNSEMKDDAVGVAELSATGTAGNTTYLRGDNTWTVPPDTNTTVGGGTGVDFNDDTKIRLGTSNDLEIYHGSDQSKIINGTGSLWLQSDNGIRFTDAGVNESMAAFYDNGAVELYYDGSKKLETTSTGVTVTTDLVTTGDVDPSADGGGNLGSAAKSWYNLFLNNDAHFADNGQALFGDGGDLALWHNGSDNFIDTKWNLTIRKDAGAETLAKFSNNGSCDLYYDNAKKLETTSAGATVTGDLTATGWLKSDTAGEGLHNTGTGGKFYSNFSNDTHLYHSSNNQVKLSFRSLGDVYRGAVNGDANGMALLTGASSDEYGILCVADGATQLYHNNSQKLATATGGVIVTGDLVADNLYLGDGEKLFCGASDDLQIYHSGSHSYIDDQGTGHLIIKTSEVDVMNAAGNEDMIKATENGAVEIYYDNVKKFETTSAGGTLHGTWTGAGGDNTPAFSAYTSTQYDLASDTWVKQLFQTEEFDSDGAYNASTSTFTVPSGKGGQYMYNVQCSVDDINQGHYLALWLYINGSGSSIRSKSFDWSPSSDKIITAGMSNVISLSAGDTVEIYALHDGTGTQGSEAGYNWFSMFRLAGV